jgi:endoglucanase
MDNRVGCAVAVEVLRRLRHTAHPNDVAAVGTVMEEVGRRGAFTASAAVKPDVAFAVDVGIAGDTPGVSKDEAASRLGEGPTVVLADGGHLAHRSRGSGVDLGYSRPVHSQPCFDYPPG